MTQQTSWILGGKNIDEDPLFSQYYLADSAQIYGAVRAFYDSTTEMYYIPVRAADKVAKAYVQKIFTNPKWMRDILAETKIILDTIEDFVDKHSITSVKTWDISTLAKVYLEQQKLTRDLYTVSRIPQALDRGNEHFTQEILTRLTQYGGIFRTLQL